MTQNTLTFSFRRKAALACVWYRTGNPARPLACKWVLREQAAAGSCHVYTAEDYVRRMCA
jgi:hypothetical protein